MNLEFLPKQVNMGLAITELGMNDMEKVKAIKIILMYSKYDGLPIYFDDTVWGIDANISIGNIVDENGAPVDSIIAEPKDIILVDGQKTLEGAYVFSNKTEKTRHVCINSFSKDNTHYRIVHESGSQYSDICIDYKELYINRDELLTFKDEMGRSNIYKEKDKRTTTNTSSATSNEIKALALLAREKSIASSGYRTGKSVNCSAFKDHIITLAKDYDISDHGLKSLDDKISKVLNEHDLREIHDTKDS